VDLGEVQVVSPKITLVIRDGTLTNLSYHLPKAKKPSRGKPSTDPPFASLSVSDAQLDLDIDGRKIKSSDIDVDVFAERGPTFEITVTDERTIIDMQHTLAATKVNDEVHAIDEDILCNLELKARVAPKSVRIRRFTVFGLADLDPKSGTRGACTRAASVKDPGQFSLQMTEIAADWAKGSAKVSGKIAARLPLSPANRFLKMPPVKGWVSLNAQVKWDTSRLLPEMTGHLVGEGIQLERYQLADKLDAEFSIEKDDLNIKRTEVSFAEGRTIVYDAKIQPLAKGAPFSSRLVETHGMTFPGLMKALGVTQHTIVAWNFGEGQVTDIKGELALPHIEAHLRTDTHDFEVFDRAFDDPARRHMIGVARALVRGRIVVEPTAFQFQDTVATFGHSQVYTPLVSIGFDNDLEVTVDNKGSLDLADISPITTIPMAGRSRLGVRLAGKASDPVLTGNLAVEDLVFGGFPLGSIQSAKVLFRPLKVQLSEVKATKGKSDYVVNSATLDFDHPGALIVDAQASSAKLDVRDFLAMWHFDRDPRYESLFGWGKTSTRVHYALGGAEDRCGAGFLRVSSQASLRHLEMYEEQYDSAEADIDFTWLDMRAGYMGVSIDLPSLTLRKGPGVLLGSVQVRPGAVLAAHAVATGIPLGRFNAFGSLGRVVDGSVTGVADVSGTLDAPVVDAQVTASRIIIGRSRLGSSDLTVKLETPPRASTSGSSRCGNPIPPPFDPADYRADKAEGAFHIDGQLFGNQVRINDLRITRQRNKHAQGTVVLKDFDISAFNEFLPASQSQELAGKISGEIQLADFPFAEPGKTKGKLAGFSALLERGNLKLSVQSANDALRLEAGNIDLNNWALKTTYGQVAANFKMSARLAQLGQNPSIDAELQLQPVDISALKGFFPKAEILSGELKGNLKIKGALSHPRTEGQLQVGGAELQLRGLDWPITNANLTIAISDGEIRIARGEANLGTGKVLISGGAPLKGLQLGQVRLDVNATDVPIPSNLGVKGSFDSRLEVGLDPNAELIRPHVTGVVTLDNLEYNRPVQMTADVSTLAQRGRRSQVEAYDPEDDKVDFDLIMHARSPLRINNELIEAELVVDKAGLELMGTNQRFGLRGLLTAKAAGRIHLRQHTFEIREGSVRFDDTTRINPRVDLRATTEYRRYSTQAPTTTGPTSASPTGTDSTTSATGGRWRITMHAHGDADELHVDLTSDPALSPDDVFMLLTVGVTRTELSQAQSASMVSSVALEALGTLSGADKTVKETIPVIDDFKFSSAYSSRTGRTEPTVTIGKRLSERIRATVTSGLAESREVRSNLEWQLSRRMSVEGSYDNVNDISSSQLGNLGADIRWRMEFR
jgi:translocation and assembly module TamB